MKTNIFSKSFLIKKSQYNLTIKRTFCLKLSKEQYEEKWKAKLGLLQDNWKVMKEESYNR